MTITITITIACIDTEGATPLPDYHTPAPPLAITIIMWFVGYAACLALQLSLPLLRADRRLLAPHSPVPETDTQYLRLIPSNLRHYPVECPPPYFPKPNALLNFSCML